MNAFANPYVRALVGGIAAAIIVASPIVDDGVTTSEYLSILGAFLSGSGLTALQPAGSTGDGYVGAHVAEDPDPFNL